MKKILSTMVIAILLLGSVNNAYAGTDEQQSSVKENKVEVVNDQDNSSIYSDLQSSNWAYKAVAAMSQKGIIKGYSDGKFRPSNEVTYGEFIKMALVAATNEDIGNSTSGNWAKSYYNKALWLKYFTNKDIKEEQLNYPIPRNDMALIISNVLGKLDIDNYEELENSLKDINSQTKNNESIIKAYASGIITGYLDNTFKPENKLTRAESATVIYRFIEPNKRVKPNLEVVSGDELETINFTMVDVSDYYDINTNPFKDGIKTMNFTDEAEYYEQPTGWNISIYKEFDGNTGLFDINTKSQYVYLVKDKKMYYCSYDINQNETNKAPEVNRFNMQNLNIREADYIVCVPKSGETDKYVKIIKNPLKTK